MMIEEIPPKEFYKVSDNAHFLAGLCSVLLGARIEHAWWAAGAIIVFAIVKEGWWDEKYETPIVRGSGWRDFFGYFLGVVTGLALVVGAK